MHHFRRFLFHTDGEFGCMFWIDVERLKQTTDKWTLKRQENRISELYLHNGAHFALSEDIRTKLWLMGEESVNVENCPHKRIKTPKKVVESLPIGQTLVVKRLKEYWYPRYRLHLEEKSHSECSDHHTLMSEVDHPSQWYKIGGRITSISELDKQKRQIKRETYLPRIISDKGNDATEVRPKRVPLVATASCKLPQLDAGSGGLNVDCLLKGISTESVHDFRINLDDNMRALQSLLSPSTLTLFPHSADSPFKHHPDCCSSLMAETARLSPYLTAALRADFISGNPFLRHLKTVVFDSKAADYLLFWQSVECILTQDEAKRWFFHFNRGSSNDRPCPYLSYLELYPVASDPKELLHLFVKDGAPHKIELAAEVRKELCVLLPKGLGQSLILSAQEIATEVSN